MGWIGEIMHDELKTIDGVMKWLEMDGSIKLDEKGAYVTRANFIRAGWKDTVYTGPPMLIEGHENEPCKLYIQEFMLESMIIRFLKDGKAEEFSPVTALLEYGYQDESRYSNHITEPDTSSTYFEGIIRMKIEKNDAGDVRYDAEIIKGSLRDMWEPKTVYPLGIVPQ